MAKQFFPNEAEFYEILEAEPKEMQVSEEYRKYYEEKTPSSSEDEEEDLNTSMRSTDTNLCSLPLMCLCTIENMERKSRN